MLAERMDTEAASAAASGLDDEHGVVSSDGERDGSDAWVWAWARWLGLGVALVVLGLVGVGALTWAVLHAYGVA